MHEGGENCLKYFRKRWNRKEGRGNKGFKRGQDGSRSGCLKKERLDPFTNYVSHCIKVHKELKMFFFQGVLSTPSSLHRQSQRYISVLSKPNSTNMVTTRLHNHVFFFKWNETTGDWSCFINVQSHLDKQLLQSTSYVYHNKILCTFLNLLLGWQMKISY